MTLGRDRPTANQKTHLSFLIRDPEENAHRAGVNALRWSPEYGTLFSAGRDSVIRKWTPGSGKESDSMEHHTDWVNDFVLCDNGEVLISASSDQD